MRAILLSLIALSFQCWAGDGKILATSGITQFEGAGGGGIVPFATLAGYSTKEQLGFTAHRTSLKLDDFELNSMGFNFNIKDRVEVSVAKQELEVEPLNLVIDQKIYGAKVKIFGDLIYGFLPQVSLGVLRKELQDDAILPEATSNSGTDYYIAVSRLHIAALFKRNLLWNVTLRSSKANQTGFLGFGGAARDSRSLDAELALAVQLNRYTVTGIEYRTKPDNLAAVSEDDWKDVFIAWAPNKHFSLTAAYTDFGSIGGLPDQTGYYLSVTGAY